MSAYIHGNLALNDRRETDADAERRRQPAKQKVLLKKTLPTGEKLLYLFTLIVCFAVMGLMSYRYAAIYETNSQLVKMESEIKALEEEGQRLKNEAAKLNDPERLLREAIQLGLLPPDEAVKLMQSSGAVALGSTE